LNIAFIDCRFTAATAYSDIAKYLLQCECIFCITRISLNRGVRSVILPANRGVILAGSYRVVRYPWCLGYMVTDIGFLAANLGIRNAVIAIVQ